MNYKGTYVENKNLYIVEDEEISNILNELGYNSIYTNGHINEISYFDFINLKPYININIEKEKDNYNYIENEIKKVEGSVILGMHPDAEGEIISAVLSKLSEKYKKNYIRNPLFGLNEEKLNDFITLKNQRELSKNMINSVLSRMVFEIILNNTFTHILHNKKELNVTLGKTQHAILLLLNEYKDYFIHKIDKFRILSLKRISEHEILINKNTILKSPPAFNTGTLFMDIINLYDIEIKKVSEILNFLYINGHITYPKTNSVSLEETSYKKLVKKSENFFELNEIIYLGNYENAISPLDLKRNFSKVEINKIYNLIIRRSISSILKSYKTNSLIYNLIFENSKNKKVILLEDEKNIITEVYQSQNVLSKSKQEHKPYYIGNGLGDYEIIKLLMVYKIGKPYTLSKILPLLLNKKFIGKEFDGLYKLEEISNEILKILNETIPFLNLEFYKNIDKDFNYIEKGLQNWEFPIKKLIKNLKKYNIDINSKLQINLKNNEELLYRNLWVKNSNQKI